MGMSFKVSSPFGPLPLMVGSSGAAAAGMGTGAGAGTAGVELLELVAVEVEGVLLSVPSEDAEEEDDDVLGSGERDRLAWLVSWLAVFLTGVPCLRVGAVPAVALSFPVAGSTTLTDFLVGSAADAVEDPLIFTAVADIFTDLDLWGDSGHTNSTPPDQVEAQIFTVLDPESYPMVLRNCSALNLGNFSFSSFITAAVLRSEKKFENRKHSHTETDLLLFTAAFFLLFLHPVDYSRN